eukprot:Lithocolla_globosa_v1_NODE_139_length_5801_cov_6.461364.p9 type:complete len:100 gc:universal NODE_139_length_5801_cov_6.461364:1650-1949(+)
MIFSRGILIQSYFKVMSVPIRKTIRLSERLRHRVIKHLTRSGTFVTLKLNLVQETSLTVFTLLWPCVGRNSVDKCPSSSRVLHCSTKCRQHIQARTPPQ